MAALSRKFTLADFRAARAKQQKLAMLTCYDFTTAKLMQSAGVPMLLVGDSAANVILGHPTTVAAPLHFQIEITAAVRRGAPKCLVIADMPFGSFGGDIARTIGFRNVIRMLKLSGADCVKLEVSEAHRPLVKELAEIGVAVIAHVGLRPQAVSLAGGYRVRGRTAADAQAVIDLSLLMQEAGAASILLEAVPSEVSQRVTDVCTVPIIGCGAGPACDAHVVVTHDAIGLTEHQPKFVPKLGDVASPMKKMFERYVDSIALGKYPSSDFEYEMFADEKLKLDGKRSSRVATEAARNETRNQVN